MSKNIFYTLIQDFIHNRMYLDQFCSMFSYRYDIEVDLDTLTPQENELFGKLARICYGYTENENEIKNLPQYYFSDQTVVDTVNEVCQKLKIE